MRGKKGEKREGRGRTKRGGRRGKWGNRMIERSKKEVRGEESMGAEERRREALVGRKCRWQKRERGATRRGKPVSWR